MRSTIKGLGQVTLSEAGNRVRKLQYLYVNGDPPGGGTGGDSIIVDEGDASGYWSLTENIFYVRDISGKEIAIYSSANLQQWNIWGLDNVGKINADTTKYYYLKDHLGSVRAVINSTNTVVSAQDYDAWGYLMENRSYQSENSKYKFTGKERDKDLENNYDYFGARYYDSRVATWGSVDPLLEKHLQWSPYNYVLRNPLRLIDPDGKQVDVTNPMYHIGKETQGIQLKSLEIQKNVETVSNKAWPYVKVAFNYGRKVAIGFYLNKRYGVTRNIFLLSVNNPTILTYVALVATFIHLTAPDLNKREEKFSEEMKEMKEKIEENERSEEFRETFENYFEDNLDDTNHAWEIGQTGTSKTMMQLSKGYKEVGF